MIESIQLLLDNTATPAITAFLLGLLTALSPCPLATNIAAIGYIGKHIENRRNIFLNGLFYMLGRTFAYTLLGILLIAIIRSGTSMLGIQKVIAVYSEMILGPALLLVGMFMLFGTRLNLPSLGFKGKGETLVGSGGIGAFLLGLLFAMAFCPTSGVFYFGMLIPMSATASMGYFLPVVFAIATSLPVLIVAWIFAFSASKIGMVYGRMRVVQHWLNIVVGMLFIVIGIYYCLIVYI